MEAKKGLCRTCSEGAGCCLSGAKAVQECEEFAVNGFPRSRLKHNQGKGTAVRPPSHDTGEE